MTPAEARIEQSADSLALDAARRALEDMSRRARMLIDTANDAVVTIDTDSIIIDWNRTAERMFGWPREEAVGRVITDLIVPPAHREAHHRGMQRFLAKPAARSPSAPSSATSPSVARPRRRCARARRSTASWSRTPTRASW